MDQTENNITNNLNIDFDTLIFDFFPIFQDISLERRFVNIILIAKDVIYICLS